MQPLRIISLLLALVLALPANAATITAPYQYAWSDQGAWVNFAPSQGGVIVEDDGLTGYAWAQNTGWISFDTTQSQVSNDGQGILGGFAWSEGEGWLSFTGVSIDSNGRFHGTATGANSTLTFDCANCDVRTDWRPGGGTTPGSSGGSSGGGTRNNPPTTPESPSTLPPSGPGTIPGVPGTGTNESSSGSTSTDPILPRTYVQPTEPPPSVSTNSTSTPVSNILPFVIGGGVLLFLLLLFFLFRFWRSKPIS